MLRHVGRIYTLSSKKNAAIRRLERDFDIESFIFWSAKYTTSYIEFFPRFLAKIENVHLFTLPQKAKKRWKDSKSPFFPVVLQLRFCLHDKNCRSFLESHVAAPTQLRASSSLNLLFLLCSYILEDVTCNPNRFKEARDHLHFAVSNEMLVLQ